MPKFQFVYRRGEILATIEARDVVEAFNKVLREDDQVYYEVQSQYLHRDRGFWQNCADWGNAGAEDGRGR